FSISIYYFIMPAVNRITKPITHKGKKAILKEPKLIENAKEALCLKGNRTSQIVTDIMKDLYDLKKPNVQMMKQKNDVLPFEDITPIEKFAFKYDASLFMIATHNKKRPHNLILSFTAVENKILLRRYAKTKKNISKDTFGTTYGRIHIGAQNIIGIQTRKMKGLKKTLSEKNT
ncbi:RPF2 factor, partial [Acromyrmex heyeri]